jgi:selenide,water dikinase
VRSLPTPTHENLIVGTETGDDAAVWRLGEDRALISTADFFAPVVDDPHTWGRIAATNAASDVYAMGGIPRFGLNLVAWPHGELPLEVLSEVLAGGAAAAAEGGWAVVGGHTVDGPEPMYGQAVTGEADEKSLLTNAGAQPGQSLVLTKPLGTGLLATAVKRSESEAIQPGGWLAETYTAGVAEMTRLNDKAATAALEAKATAATDITGFGLLGHLQKLAAASGTGAVIQAEAVPVLPNAWELLDQGFAPGGTARNLDHVRPWVKGTDDQRVLTMLADAQTSGGLLFGCSPGGAAEVVAHLVDQGHTAAVVGEITATDPGYVVVV